ncbi:hypothetical protein RFI_25603, partial [Reticulomyxa filosa]
MAQSETSAISSPEKTLESFKSDRPWKYLSEETLLKWLSDEKNKEKPDFVIIDVRDSDYGPLCLKESKNHPSQRFESELRYIIPAYREKAHVIFHCAYSQSRGPSAASVYAKVRANDKAYKDYPQQSVHVLSGGFNGFSAKYPPKKPEYKNLYVSTVTISTSGNDDDTNETEDEETDTIVYIDGNTLVEWLNDESKKDLVQVIDVRDDDFVDYKIKTATNHPRYEFESSKYVNQLMDTYKHKRYLIFHCAFSQQRGPAAAGIYWKARRSSSFPKQTVCVLKHGFRGFYMTHASHCPQVCCFQTTLKEKFLKGKSSNHFCKVMKHHRRNVSQDQLPEITTPSIQLEEQDSENEKSLLLSAAVPNENNEARTDKGMNKTSSSLSIGLEHVPYASVANGNEEVATGKLSVQWPSLNEGDERECTSSPFPPPVPELSVTPRRLQVQQPQQQQEQRSTSRANISQKLSKMKIEQENKEKIEKEKEKEEGKKDKNEKDANNNKASEQTERYSMDTNELIIMSISEMKLNGSGFHMQKNTRSTSQLLQSNELAMPLSVPVTSQLPVTVESPQKDSQHTHPNDHNDSNENNNNDDIASSIPLSTHQKPFLSNSNNSNLLSTDHTTSSANRSAVSVGSNDNKDDTPDNGNNVDSIKGLSKSNKASNNNNNDLHRFVVEFPLLDELSKQSIFDEWIRYDEFEMSYLQKYRNQNQMVIDDYISVMQIRNEFPFAQMKCYSFPNVVIALQNDLRQNKSLWFDHFVLDFIFYIRNN